MLNNERITERLKNANESRDYFLEESMVNELIKESKESRFEEGCYYVMRFEKITVTLFLDDEVSTSTKIDGERYNKYYKFRIETWGTYQRNSAASEQREIILL